MVALISPRMNVAHLVRLIQTCEQCIGTIAQTRRVRLAQREVLYRKPASSREEQEQEQALAELRATELVVRTRLPVEVLLPFVSEKALERQIEHSQRQDEKFARLSRSQDKPWVNRVNRTAILGSLIWTDGVLLEILGDLQGALLESLENTKDSTSVKLPRNPKVIELINRIASNPENLSRSQLAVEISDGDEKEARTLLRQERRFRDVFNS